MTKHIYVLCNCCFHAQCTNVLRAYALLYQLETSVSGKAFSPLLAGTEEPFTVHATLSFRAYAHVKITLPTEHCITTYVVHRSNHNKATLPAEGQCPLWPPPKAGYL